MVRFSDHADPIHLTRQKQMFRFLVLARWVALLPAGLTILLPPSSHDFGFLWPALLFAIALNLAIALFRRPIHDIIFRYPWLMALDLLFAAALVGYTGAEASPFFFYALMPILATAFFFGIQGGMTAASFYALCYLSLVFLLPRPPTAEIMFSLVSMQVIGFFLLAAMMGYVALLLDELQQAHDALAENNRILARQNRDLHVLQELTLLLQSSADPAELQEYILQGIVTEMGFPRAVIGLYNEEQDALTGWLCLEDKTMQPSPEPLRHATTLYLHNESGPISTVMCTQRWMEILDGTPPVNEPHLASRLVTGQHYIIFPLTLRESPLGVLIVDHLPEREPLPVAERHSLECLTAHGSVALGSVRLCINRAQQQAVLAERHRIATDLHDSISQMLYGLAYGLDACIQLLPQHPQAVLRELQRLQPVVTEAQALMRQAIFAMHAVEITSETFSASLHRHLRVLCPTRDMTLRIEVPGEFDRWQPEIRHELFRVAQEAMTNAARHADASRIVVTVIAGKDRVGVQVEDNGRGFELDEVEEEGHLGIRSMAARVHRLGGKFHIESKPRGGTVVMASIPVYSVKLPPKPIFQRGAR